MKKVAIVQPNYIPWIGYFQLINYVDEFILLDDVQYTKRDWRNRNSILTKDGLQWLTIPVNTKGRKEQLIKDVIITNDKWKSNHFESIRHNYGFCKDERIFPLLEHLYSLDFKRLLEVQVKFISEIMVLLNIETKITLSSNLNGSFGKNNRLIDLVKEVNGEVYISGVKANSYLDENLFKMNNIEVKWFNYDLNFNYEQKNKNNFTPYVSIIDFLCNNPLDLVNIFNSYNISI